MTCRAFADWPVHTAELLPLYEQVCRAEVPHALLFIGNPQVTHLFTEFLAKTLFCTKDPAPCGKCDACRRMEHGSYPDYHVVDGETESALKTAEIESLQAKLALRAHAGKLVYVVRGIDRATPVAANRLLKTLEEPAGNVIALLTARQLQRVLPTIVSRCQVFRLGGEAEGKPWEDAVAWQSPPPEGANDWFAALLPAVIQWTETFLRQEASGIALADAWMQAVSGAEPADALLVLSLWLRDLLHWRLGDHQYIRFTEYLADIERQSRLAEVHELSEAVRLVLDARMRLQSHVAAQLNAEQLCVRLSHVRKGGRFIAADSLGQPR